KARYYTSAPQCFNWVGLGHPACNEFVRQVLEDVGLQYPLATDWRQRLRYLLGKASTPEYPALAGDWATRHSVLGCWKNVTLIGPPRLQGDPVPADLSRPGDIIAQSINYTDATGHVGIVVGSGQTASADSAASCIPPLHSPDETVDISDFGFRPDGWVDPYTNPATGRPCRTTGLKRDAVVK